MADKIIYQRDEETGQLLPIKAVDNLDGTYGGEIAILQIVNGGLQ
jgi:hypothetical protein